MRTSVGIAGFDSGIACLQQWNVYRRSDVAVAHLARQVFFIPYLARLHFAGVPGRERLIAHKRRDIGAVFRIADGRCCHRQAGVRCGNRAAVELRIGHQPRVEQVQRLDAPVRLELHDLAPEDLHLEAVEHESARDRVAEGPHVPALLKEAPETVVVDAIVRLGEESRIARLAGCLGLSRGDLYTAYTFIAVPALVYGSGALGLFIVPYTVIAYPFVFMVMPRLWRVAREHGYITAADFVRGCYGSSGWRWRWPSPACWRPCRTSRCSSRECRSSWPAWACKVIFRW